MRIPVVSIRRTLFATKDLKWFTTSNILRAEAESSLDNLQYYARKRQTNVSLRALMETGNGKYLNDSNTGMNSLLSDASANEKILIQVNSFVNAMNKSMKLFLTQ